jgi:AcrR family transcriptional regulator
MAVSTFAVSIADNPSHKSPGRPRSTSVRRSILDSTLRLLDEVGYAKLTVEGVAGLAQAGKATIYRWWSNKARLVGEALMEETNSEFVLPDTGSVREDFRLQLQLLAELFGGPKGKRLAMMMGVAQEEPETLVAFRNSFLDVRKSEALQILQRGVDRGEVRAEIFPDVAVDALYSPLYFRLMVDRTSLTPEYIDRLCELVMTGLLRRSN